MKFFLKICQALIAYVRHRRKVHQGSMVDFKRGTLLLDDITNRSKIKSIEIVTIKLIQYTR